MHPVIPLGSACNAAWKHNAASKKQVETKGEGGTVQSAGVQYQVSANSLASSVTSGKLNSDGSQVEPSVRNKDRAPSFCQPSTVASACNSLQHSRTASSCSLTADPPATGFTSLHPVCLTAVTARPYLPTAHCTRIFSS